jgi:glutamyl-tRNA synthetase
MTDTTPIRVRFAPSPTGFLHVGGARTALFNWLLARHSGGTFVLRIEDTDRERSNDEMTRAIVDGMTWLGLDWDEGPLHQAEGTERHRADALSLLEHGRAYRCFCTQDELDARRAVAGDGYRYDRRCSTIARDDSDRRAAGGEPHTIRFLVPDGATEWNDVVHGPIEFANADIEDFIILRTDGSPIYNMAVVSDDAHMSITHVVRGADHISNTPKQILLYTALGLALPVFAHVPLILGTDGKRLSKRHGATAVGEYRNEGILPDAMVNFLALLGWYPGDDIEILSRDEMTERFTLEGINRKSAVFDPVKLSWLNGQYLIRMTAGALLDEVAPLLVERGWIASGEIDARRPVLLRMVELLKTRARTIAELADQAEPYVRGQPAMDPAAVAKHWKNAAETKRRLTALRTLFADAAEWDEATLEAAVRGLAEAEGVGVGKVIHPLRVAVTGLAASPGIFDVLGLLGRDRTLERIDRALDRLADMESEGHAG